MRVREFMTTPAATVAPDDSLFVADGIMSLGGIRHLPVVEGDEVMGVLSQRDILQAPGLLAPSDGLAVDTAAALKLIQAHDVMSAPPIIIAAEATVEEAAERLVQHRVGCLPVIDSGTLAGIVTSSDVLRALAGVPHSAAAAGT